MAHKKVLLVEGSDDTHVFKAIFGQHGLAHLDEIKDHGGYNPLIEAFPVRLLESDVSALGLVVDADLDVESRWTAVRNRLMQAGYENVPTHPIREGLVLPPPEASLLPKVGVWIMPNNEIPGILETFLAFLVPEGDGLFAFAEDCLQKMPAELRRYRPVDYPKTKIHTWLAWQEQPGRPLGQSITSRVLSAESRECQIVVEWLRRVYEAE